MAQSNPAVLGPVESSVRPHAWADDKVMTGQVGNCASDAAKTYWQRSNQFDRMMAERLTHPLYALPPELAEYLLRHLRQKRAALDGFLRLGNEKSRAKRLDAWIACLAGPNAKFTGPRVGQWSSDEHD